MTTTSTNTAATQPAGHDEPETAPAVTLGQLDTTSADRIALGFYGIAAVAALVGQTWAALDALTKQMPTGWALVAIAIPVAMAAGVIELGGVATSALADLRQRKGERAIVLRLLSALVAAWAIGFNAYGHRASLPLAVGFAGFSAFAYVFWLAHSATRRRDALVKAGKLADTPPRYGFVQWVKEPALTRRARQLALENGLTIWASLAAAREEKRTADTRRAIGGTVEKIIRRSQKDPLLADIAVTTYDLDQLARLIEERADYAGWADEIGASLLPAGRRAAERAGTRAADDTTSGTIGTPSVPLPLAVPPRAAPRWVTVPPGTATLPIVPGPRAATPVESTPDPAAVALAVFGMPPGTPDLDPVETAPPVRLTVPSERAGQPASSHLPPASVPPLAGTRAVFVAPAIRVTPASADVPPSHDPTVPLPILGGMPDGTTDSGTTGKHSATVPLAAPEDLPDVPERHDVERMTAEEARQAAQHTVIACRRAGVRVTGATLAAAYGKSERWGRDRIREVTGRPAGEPGNALRVIG
jgi:hypothetical protein